MARHGAGRRNGLSGRTKKLDSELWQQDVDQQNGTRGSFRFPPDRRHQKRTTDVLRKPDNCKSYRHWMMNSVEVLQTDVAIVGGGAAGTYAALNLHRANVGTIIICKGLVGK